MITQQVSRPPPYTITGVSPVRHAATSDYAEARTDHQAFLTARSKMRDSPTQPSRDIMFTRAAEATEGTPRSIADPTRKADRRSGVRQMPSNRRGGAQ